MDKLPTPIGTKITILREIQEAKSKGVLHIQYMKYLSSLSYSSNMLLPYYDEYNDKICDLIVINNPDDAERIAFNHVRKTPYLKNIVYDSIISTTDTDHWKQQRQSYKDAFSVDTELKELIPTINKRAQLSVKLLQDKQKICDDEYVNIYDFFLNETMAQLQLAMFGFSNEYQEKSNKKIRAAFRDMNAIKGRSFVKSLLNETQTAKGPLSKIMKARNLKANNKREEFGNALIFPFAGHDTTANTLTWLIYELSKNDYAYKKLQDEIDQFWQTHTDNNNIVYDDLKQLKYMTRCIMEILRLWTAIPNGTFRELDKSDYIIGKDGEKIEIPSGTYVQIPNWTRHRNPELWGEDVNTFNPDRDFRDEEFYFDKGINSYNPASERFSPFTYGPRDCIGKNFSQIEMRIILLHLLKHFTFSLPKNQLENYDQDHISLNGVTMGPRSIYNKDLYGKLLGMYVNVIPRQQPSKL
jgi:cytochrome P450